MYTTISHFRAKPRVSIATIYSRVYMLQTDYGGGVFVVLDISINRFVARRREIINYSGGWTETELGGGGEYYCCKSGMKAARACLLRASLLSIYQGRSDGGYIGIYTPPKSVYLTNFYVVTGCFFLFDLGQIVVDFEIGMTS